MSGGVFRDTAFTGPGVKIAFAEYVREPLLHGEAAQGRRGHDGRKRHLEEENGDEGQGAEQVKQRMLERLMADAQHRLDDHRHHHRLVHDGDLPADLPHVGPSLNEERS